MNSHQEMPPSHETKNLRDLADLRQELAEIESELAKIVPIEATATGDDVAEAQETRDQQQQIVATRKERQVEIERALIWKASHGNRCAVCDQTIENARLEADLASITCIEHRDQEDTVEI